MSGQSCTARQDCSAPEHVSWCPHKSPTPEPYTTTELEELDAYPVGHQIRRKPGLVTVNAAEFRTLEQQHARLLVTAQAGFADVTEEEARAFERGMFPYEDMLSPGVESVRKRLAAFVRKRSGRGDKADG